MTDVLLLQYTIERLVRAHQRHYGRAPIPLTDTPIPTAWATMLERAPLPEALQTGALQMLRGRAMYEADRLLREGDAYLPTLAVDLVVEIETREAIDVVLELIDQALPGPTPAE